MVKLFPNCQIHHSLQTEFLVQIWPTMLIAILQLGIGHIFGAMTPRFTYKQVRATQKAQVI